MLKYSLQVVSQNPEFRGQKLVPYFVEGIETVGVYGSEPFALRFRNHTAERVQVRFSIDGTDILTVQPATTATTGKMFLVEAYGTLTLEAWPESNEKGARFVFGAVGDSVASHTHGDVSMKGIIGAAVFTDASPPARVYYQSAFNSASGFESYKASASASSGTRSRGATKSAPEFLGLNLERERARVDYSPDDNEVTLGAASANLGPAVGAGETVKQALASVKGLNEPRLAEVISMKYVWFDDLKAKLQGNAGNPFKHPTGFRNPPEEKLANLGTTPRQQEVKRTEFEVQRTSW